MLQGRSWVQKKDLKRVLLLTHYYPAHRGGVEIVAGQLASRLADAHEILWLAADCDEAPQWEGVRCEPSRAWNGLEKNGLPWPVWELRAWLRLRQAVAECDILYVHDFIYLPHLVVLMLVAGRKRPVVVTQHIGDIDYPGWLSRNILKLINRTLGRWLLGRADQVIFISPRVKAGFELFTRFRRPPLYWPNGVDGEIFCPVPADERARLRVLHGLSLDSPVLLFVGRFVERKGLHLLKQMALARPEWQWCFAGWGPLDPEDWQLPNVWVWKGLQGQELAALYQLADLFVLPSHGEGFPLVVQESLSCGTPAVISEETAAGGGAMPGCIVPVPFQPHNPDANVWLQAIDACLNGAEKQERRHRCAEMAQALWSWEQLASNYRDLFSILLGR